MFLYPYMYTVVNSYGGIREQVRLRQREKVDL